MPKPKILLQGNLKEIKDLISCTPVSDPPNGFHLEMENPVLGAVLEVWRKFTLINPQTGSKDKTYSLEVIYPKDPEFQTAEGIEIYKDYYNNFILGGEDAYIDYYNQDVGWYLLHSD